MSAEKYVKQLLDLAEVQIPRDIEVHRDIFYKRVFRGGSLGFGESYMDGDWDTNNLDVLVCKLLKAKLDEKIKKNWHLYFRFLAARILNLQSIRRALRVVDVHYNLGNDLFQLMLDESMVYTCAYWETANSLKEAQEAKLDLVCKKLELESGMRVLDIGCGFGSFAKYAALHYGVDVVGISISTNQLEFGRKICVGLPVELCLEDYRDIPSDKSFDRIVSLGMFEHVGYKNHRKFMQVADRCLKDDGLFLLHTIGRNSSAKDIDPWIAKYVFPNSVLPSVKQIGRAIEDYFVVEDMHNIGVHYDTTLLAWYHNFAKSQQELPQGVYNERFRRMWKYYLLACAGSFRARDIHVWQWVFSKNGVPGGYVSIR